MDTTVSLDDEQARSIAAGAAAGRCASSSDVVLAALRLLERAETEDVGKLRFLREAWQEGIDSGDAGDLDARGRALVGALPRGRRPRAGGPHHRWRP